MDWDARGYTSSQIQDVTGTILLAELANGRNMAGNDWPSFCAGSGPGTFSPDLYQINNTPPGAANDNHGWVSYGLHSQRFNCLSHDGQVGLHKVTETIGRGTPGLPAGMWTMKPGGGWPPPVVTFNDMPGNAPLLLWRPARSRPRHAITGGST